MTTNAVTEKRLGRMKTAHRTPGCENPIRKVLTLAHTYVIQNALPSDAVCCRTSTMLNTRSCRWYRSDGGDVDDDDDDDDDDDGSDDADTPFAPEHTDDAENQM